MYLFEEGELCPVLMQITKYFSIVNPDVFMGGRKEEGKNNIKIIKKNVLIG